MSIGSLTAVTVPATLPKPGTKTPPVAPAQAPPAGPSGDTSSLQAGQDFQGAPPVGEAPALGGDFTPDRPAVPREIRDKMRLRERALLNDPEDRALAVEYLTKLGPAAWERVQALPEPARSDAIALATLLNERGDVFGLAQLTRLVLEGATSAEGRAKLGPMIADLRIGAERFPEEVQGVLMDIPADKAVIHQDFRYEPQFKPRVPDLSSSTFHQAAHGVDRQVVERRAEAKAFVDQNIQGAAPAWEKLPPAQKQAAITVWLALEAAGDVEGQAHLVKLFIAASRGDKTLAQAIDTLGGILDDLAVGAAISTPDKLSEAIRKIDPAMFENIIGIIVLAFGGQGRTFTKDGVAETSGISSVVDTSNRSRIAERKKAEQFIADHAPAALEVFNSLPPAQRDGLVRIGTALAAQGDVLTLARLTWGLEQCAPNKPGTEGFAVMADEIDRLDALTAQADPKDLIRRITELSGGWTP